MEAVYTRAIDYKVPIYPEVTGVGLPVHTEDILSLIFHNELRRIDTHDTPSPSKHQTKQAKYKHIFTVLKLQLLQGTVKRLSAEFYQYYLKYSDKNEAKGWQPIHLFTPLQLLYAFTCFVS